MALVFYYKDMLEKVTMQRTQQFSASSFLPKEHVVSQKIAIEWKLHSRKYAYFSRTTH